MNKPAKYFKNDPEFLKYGYYKINKFKSFSKLEAWQYARDNNLTIDDIQYIFNDDKFSKFDWAIEPTESIESLYIKRATEIRKKYDYLILFYSGGIDSHVILETFLNNDIKIDEIITFHNSLDDKTGLFNKEVFNVAIPYIESLDLKKRGIKYRLVDIGPSLIQEFQNATDYANNKFYSINGLHSLWSNWIRLGVSKIAHFQDHIKLSKNNNTVAYIWGLDKPNMTISDDGYYIFRYIDSVPDFGAKTFINKTVHGDVLSNVYDESFFVSMESPEIVIKQCHLIANEFNKMNYDDPRLTPFPSLQEAVPYVLFNSSNLLSKNELVKIIYPNSPYSMFGDDKISGSIILSKKNMWFYRQKSDIRNKMITELKKMFRENNDYFYYTLDGTPISPKFMFTKIAYKIKKII